MHKHLFPMLAALLVAGCASTPDPPSVNGRHRVQINSQADQDALAVRAFPPAPTTAPVVLRPSAPPVAYSVAGGCVSGQPLLIDTLKNDAKVPYLVTAGLQRVELHASTDADTTVPQRRTQRCVESAYRWLTANGVPPSQIFVNYGPAPGGWRGVDIRFFRR